MSTEQRGTGGEVTVSLVRGVERHPALIHWRWLGPQLTLRMVWAGPELHASGADAFEALTALRAQLEPSGWFVAVQGARRDTYPSGMARDMGGGFSVYVLQIGRPVQDEDRVATFDAADPTSLGTVAEQEQHWRLWGAWLRSL